MKRKNGITLIALVITIIVLLILAGVTILALFGDNGIINKARRCKRAK
jgi:type II secretory pathway pseudopilin PulG